MTIGLLVFGLMLLGLSLIAIEILVPGFGVPGILGIAASGGGIYVAATQLSGMHALIALAAAFAGAGVVFWAFPRSRVGKSMVLQESITGGAADDTLIQLLDRTGTSLTPLRPSGSVDIDDRPVDVVTDGQYVDAGTKVRVVRVEGNRVVVEPID